MSLQADNNVNLLAGTHTTKITEDNKNTGWSVGTSIGLASGSLMGLNASAYKATENGVTDMTTHTGTAVTGADSVSISSGQDTNITGSKVKGNTVAMNVGKDLNITSLQDTKNYTNRSNNTGMSISTNFTAVGTMGSISSSKGKMDSTYASVTDQAGIYAGNGGFTINTKGTTTLTGAGDATVHVTDKAFDIAKLEQDTTHSLQKLDEIFDKEKIEERQELARLVAKEANTQLHNWKPTSKEGKLAKSLTHGVVAEIVARIGGNPTGSGFTAGMTNEAILLNIKQIAKLDPDVAQWLSVAIGGLVNKGIGKAVNAGATVAQYGTKWNGEAEDQEIIYRGSNGEIIGPEEARQIEEKSRAESNEIASYNAKMNPIDAQDAKESDYTPDDNGIIGYSSANVNLNSDTPAYAQEIADRVVPEKIPPYGTYERGWYYANVLKREPTGTTPDGNHYFRDIDSSQKIGYIDYIYVPTNKTKTKLDRVAEGTVTEVVKDKIGESTNNKMGMGGTLITSLTEIAINKDKYVARYKRYSTYDSLDKFHLYKGWIAEETAVPVISVLGIYLGSPYVGVSVGYDVKFRLEEGNKKLEYTSVPEYYKTREMYIKQLENEAKEQSEIDK